MYRRYLKSSLETGKLKEINRNSPENIKYCNGICQDFREKNLFSGQHVLCNNCRNLLNLAYKQVNENKITIDDFKKNPEIVNGVDIVFDTTKKCFTCKEIKSINNFETKRNECKACKSIKDNERNNKDIDILISDIQKTKSNLQYLENLLKDTSKDRLIKVISHFKIGRKSTDSKDKMIFNTLEHFKKLLNPLLCQGGCGYTMQSEFTTCKKCDELKIKPKAIIKRNNFSEELDDIVNSLSEITHDSINNYTREQYYKIADKLGLKIPQKTKKLEVINVINEFLKKKEKEQIIEVQKNDEEISLNGVIIMSRKEDGFINATALCKAGSKKFNDWSRLEKSKSFIEILSTSAGIPAYPLINIIENGVNEKRGTWVHPRVAINIAQWISPKFDVQVSGWVHELAITGTVSIGKEKTNDQLLELQNKLLNTEKNFKELEKRHNKLLRKREYHTFKKGPAFYIISTSENKYKIGFEGVDISIRFRSYRTLVPDLKIHYIAYTEKAHMLEDNMLSRFDLKKLENNHEVVVDIELSELINSANTLISFCNYKATIEDIEELNKYNI
jgi:hypothetical protein